MEVATTNNHSQSHHHLQPHQRLNHNHPPHHHHHHLQLQTGTGTGNSTSNVVSGNGNGGARSPFQREVREWQRIDPDTGALFSGRVEADRWINGPLNSYGKISDSQNISQPNGTQHTHRKQLEVLQARTANGAMQVIRTQTVQKSSSTSRWSSSSTTTTTTSSSNTTANNKSHWAQPLPATPLRSHSVDICEVSDDDCSSSSSGGSHNGNTTETTTETLSQPVLELVLDPIEPAAMQNGVGEAHIDDHVDFMVINDQTDTDDDGDRHRNGDDSTHLHRLGHNLLPDTAPSLKLSNLMKSSSSISSQSSSNSNLTTATTSATTSAAAAAANTHRSASKISLHAIVGPSTGPGTGAGMSTTTTTAATKTTIRPQTAASSSAAAATLTSTSTLWHKRLTEQPDLYGNSNNSNSSKLKSIRVGSIGGGGGGGGGADVAVGTPTQCRDLESFRHYNDDGNKNDGDDDLRLTARHLRRQQVSQSVYDPPAQVVPLVPLQRSRSISTDDLSNDWERQQSDEEPGEWRRVSKLRRSFQSQDYHNNKTPSAVPISKRPLDLPSNSVSVSRIRAELENGRRLNTAMRNNHVDLAALDSILNSPPAAVASKPAVAKRSTFLTAESLQEIRGKLKKLSDESLYKEDFLAHTHKSKRPELIVEQPPVVVSAFRPVRPQHTTHSLESRQRQKDTSSSEWHLRRKSYGFEKMSPPEDKSIYRVDASTDSGLGRSGEQLGNWSPTERTAGTTNGGTVIHFGAAQKNQQLLAASPTDGELSKRHSIAVEETWRDNRKTSQVHVNGGATEVAALPQAASRSSAQKRVEFCKTEVHFAAESGRVNIVETDGKPPPTQNFRRRRRTASGPLQSLVKQASAVSNPNTNGNSSKITQFSDDVQRRKTIASSTVAYRATLMDPPELATQSTSGTTQVTVSTMPKPLELRLSQLETSVASRNSYTSTSGVDTTDNETDELFNIRGILKNKPVKPKPYHLGENIESADVLWSVPTMKITDNSVTKENGEESPVSPKSVAERVRIAEQRHFAQQQQHHQSSPAGNGYSTKINLNLGAEDFGETGNKIQRRASVQELLLQDLRAHQRILDEGLKSTSLIMKTMRSANEFDEAMRRLSIASIESALIQPTIVVPTPMMRSHSYQEESSRRSSTTSITSSDLFGSTLYDSLPRVPLAPPRMKLLGNAHIPVSQQLTQLRRMYDAADEEADSADEEVKRYFRDSDSGGGTQDSSSLEDVRTGTEYSSSWSRLKAKRTIWKIEAQEQTMQRPEMPKSNIMNIALHAPKVVDKSKPTPPTLRIGQLVPVAKPRTLFVQPQPTNTMDTMAEDSTNESLKIVKEARGARKLRDHELSYFGVQAQLATPTTKLNNSTTTTSSNPRRTLPSRSKLTHNEDATTTTTTKWQLLNDRPDLLQHSPRDIDVSRPNDNNDEGDDDDNDNDNLDAHFYENIANEVTTTFRVKSPSPMSYERKADLQRDAQILSEMTRTADQTLKAISDEAALKDQRRRSTSLQRRSAKPLETIDEKVYQAERQAPSVARGTFASEARRNSRQSTPSPGRNSSSSQSSVECCPRARSRSLSSEREFTRSKAHPRSSSRESIAHGGGGSSDEQLTTQPPREERLRMSTPKHREKSRHEDPERQRHRSKQRTSSSSESKHAHHHSSRHREAESNSSAIRSSGHRLVRSSRVSEENRPRTTAQRSSDRSRASEKHRDELTRSRGHSSRSRYSEQQARDSKSSKHSHSHNHSGTNTTSTTTTRSHEVAHKRSTSKPSSSTKATQQQQQYHHNHHKVHTSTSQQPHNNNNEQTHGKNTSTHHQVNGHHHHSQHGNTSSSKHPAHGSLATQQHHVHNLTTTTIAATKHQRDRHGKDRK